MNLQEIREKEYKKHVDDTRYDFTVECMREAVRPALELAAEREEVTVECPFFSMTKKAIKRPKALDEWYTVNKKSILDVMEEIE